jgi:hypothetical protein
MRFTARSDTSEPGGEASPAVVIAREPIRFPIKQATRGRRQATMRFPAYLLGTGRAEAGAADVWRRFCGWRLPL